ncbi:TlyA family RNA methyltransferase [Acuticoccus sp. I52.16.1]|uniref:TlyA family RNA methyltransferase n=1 Tax=Acuticoccus sp. I52.16.1 TaxID=2928472 RepID=UPI001FD4A2DC|nr:TlyA family RNA methyltransferase [Acuticoccus sp. I52.16.1]UOM33325.1 TlyA family RNA methyltransferase [Acuticoccus sp. I52.16.1]
MTRLDVALVERGLSRTRSQAREAILRGVVRVDGAVVTRAGHRVAPQARLETEGETYVSRAAHKLVAALDHFAIDPAGAHALDIGASTGGFTEVLLARGAAHVVALDVGRDQLVAALRRDARVTVMEGFNARALTAADLAYAPDLVVSDVSFISLRLALPPALRLAAPGARLAALVKPQFEVGPAHIGKGGLVKDEAAARLALDEVVAAVTACGWRVAPPIPSPIEGGDGNREWLIAAERDAGARP